ncbi:hypothetical protein Lalb_Chr07g0193591 [Lupinus albus]|uniref:Uncharacterized protein n=1 Tax=Lupinus albus TaxID=3870 RepID=A0A6A4QBS5_LUPAL|nr:hypothetical protein Lalb_Chr07g0193591 [Lupinus albus]
MSHSPSLFSLLNMSIHYHVPSHTLLILHFLYQKLNHIHIFSYSHILFSSKNLSSFSLNQFLYFFIFTKLIFLLEILLSYYAHSL